MNIRLELLEGTEDYEKAIAALGVNPSYLWGRFILTDDQPNGNKQRVPYSEFKNLITTGVYAPIKMASGKPGDHQESYPIGVITQLREKKVGEVNQIVGLAAFWGEERGEELDHLRKQHASGNALDLSWEIRHKDVREAEDGVTDLIGTYLTSTVLVEVPAYGGRTFIEDLFTLSTLKPEDNPDMDEKVLEELRKNYEEKYSALQAELEEVKKELESAKAEVTTSTTELEELRAYKQEIEDAVALENRKASIRTRFSEAEVEISDEYFEKNEATLLKLGDEELDFFIETMKEAQAGKKREDEEGEKSESSFKVPQLEGSAEDRKTAIKNIASALRKQRNLK